MKTITRIWSTISRICPKISKIAQRLSLNQEQIDDPHIERLIQAFSLIAARIDKN